MFSDLAILFVCRLVCYVRLSVFGITPINWLGKLRNDLFLSSGTFKP